MILMRRSQALKIPWEEHSWHGELQRTGDSNESLLLKEQRVEQCCWSIRKKQEHEEKLLIFSHTLFLEKLQKQGDKDPSN